MFDYISVGTFWTTLLIIHSLAAVATLAALTHQAMSIAMPARPVATPAGSVTRFRPFTAPARDRAPEAFVHRQYLQAAGVR